MFDAVCHTPIGKLGIVVKQEYLSGIKFLPRQTKTIMPSSRFASEVVQQLSKYFDKKLIYFDLPLSFAVTNFTQKVLDCLKTIPLGKTVTYGELADQLQTSPRAVGNACRNNPLPIIIPCHRVIARNNIGGYSGAVDGYLLEIKLWLLAHENLEDFG